MTDTYKFLKKHNGYMDYPGAAFVIFRVQIEDEEIFTAHLFLFMRYDNDVNQDVDEDSQSISFVIGNTFKKPEDAMGLIETCAQMFDQYNLIVPVVDLATDEELKVLQLSDMDGEAVPAGTIH